MERRASDLIRRQLREAELLLAARIATGQSTGEVYLKGEINRLRAQLENEEMPERRGRRLTDRLVDTQLALLPAMLTGLLVPKAAWDLDD
jgi:hypothetical protein